MTDRRQRVAVLGVTSDSLPVCSGVPQGSILGPLLFLLYVNDLPEAVKSSHVSMFADDTKLYSTITSQEDVKFLQTDIKSLEYWSSVSGLSFNQSKCKHQRITRKVLPITSSYKLITDVKISDTVSERDLGVCVSSNLTWKKKVFNQTTKANKLFGYIRRNAQFITSTAVRRSLYLALVRSHFGCATQLWAPQSIDLIYKLERTQSRATMQVHFKSSVHYRHRI